MNNNFYDIEYLMNIKKSTDNKNKVDKISKKNKKFYRKRINSITNELILDNFKEIDKYPEINSSFSNYIGILINYFKLLDKNELLQNEYDDNENIELKLEDCTNMDIDEINCTENTCTNMDIDNFNKIMVTKKSTKINTLDNFVVKKINKINDEIFNNLLLLPQKKILNLKDPKFKTKGVRKKKNVDINYGEKIHNEEKNKAFDNDESKK